MISRKRAAVRRGLCRSAGLGGMNSGTQTILLLETTWRGAGCRRARRTRAQAGSLKVRTIEERPFPLLGFRVYMSTIKGSFHIPPKNLLVPELEQTLHEHLICDLLNIPPTWKVGGDLVG